MKIKHPIIFEILIIIISLCSCESQEPSQEDVRELKIDVFDDIAIATYYPHVSFIQNGEEKTGSGRQTFVFLSTVEGWKLVHEHGTPQQH